MKEKVKISYVKKRTFYPMRVSSRKTEAVRVYFQGVSVGFLSKQHSRCRIVFDGSGCAGVVFGCYICSGAEKPSRLMAVSSTRRVMFSSAR